MAEPMYRQIADDLRRKIETGELKRGSQLPTELDLRDQYETSRNTVRDAIKWLTTLGLVEIRPGQGIFVTERIAPFVIALTGEPHGRDEAIYKAEVEASKRTPSNSPPRVEVQRAPLTVAQALHIEAGAQVVSRHEQRLIDGTPWSLQTSYYPMTLVTDKGATMLIQATDIPEGAVEYLARKCGLQQAGYRDSIAVRAPDENEAAFFKIPGDGRVSVFEIFRIGFDETGGRIRLTITVYPTDRNRFVVNVGDTPPSNIEDAPP